MSRIFDRIRIVPDKTTDPEPEDIFAAAPGWLFPDDCLINHGESESTIVYMSTRFGEIKLRAADPTCESERQLYAQFLWNAELRLAMFIEEDTDKGWSVKDETVLEFGAGTGLAGIVSLLSGAKEVVLSDYPAETVLETARNNVLETLSTVSQPCYQVLGYIWGNVSSPFAMKRKGEFTRILAADCFWMPGEHENLVTSMLHFLNEAPDSRVFMIAGFHTGRAKLAAFFDIAESRGLEIGEIYEEDAEGKTRAWAKVREGGTEHHGERKRWQVVAKLHRRIGDVA